MAVLSVLLQLQSGKKDFPHDVCSKRSEASAGQQGVWHSAFVGQKSPWHMWFGLWCRRLCEWLRGGFFRGVFAAVSGDGHILYFSGPIKHSENASIPSMLWSHYHRVVKHEFISPSLQGLCSALTANTMKDVCSRGNPSELDGQRVLMGHHRFSFLGKG